MGHPVCGSPVVSLWVPGLDQCLWVTLCVGHLLFLSGSFGLIGVCGSPCVWVTFCFVFWVPVFDQCLWVTRCVGHPLFIFGSLGLISVGGSPCVLVTLCFSLGPLALSVSVGHPVCGSPFVSR